MDDVLTLLPRDYSKNQYGVDIPANKRREVYVRVDSITRAEAYAAGRSGLNPQFKFTVFFGDYQGESLCEFHGKPYAIYRTYAVPGTDDMELYVERKGGTNGAQ